MPKVFKLPSSVQEQCHLEVRPHPSVCRLKGGPILFTTLNEAPLGELDEHLAYVLAIEKAKEGLRCVLDPPKNGLTPDDAALLDPAGHVGKEGLAHVEVVGDDEPLKLKPFCYGQKQVGGARFWVL